MSGPEWFLVGIVVLLLCAAAGWWFGGRRSRDNRPPPAAWWVCGSCHSVNQIGPGGVDDCYACHRPPDPNSVGHLQTASAFTVSQQVGGSRKGGWDRDVSAMLAPLPDPTGPPSADPAPPADR